MKILKTLFASLYAAIPLMAMYAILIAVATFIENDHGSNIARALVYNTWFFNAIHAWLLICLVGVILRYKFWARKKYASLILHLSFVVIILGAGITRFFGEEGMMRIREGEAQSSFVTNEIFLNLLVVDNEKKYRINIPTNISYATKKPLNERVIFGEKSFTIKSSEINKITNDKNDATAELKAVISYENKEYPLTLIGGGGIAEDAILEFDDGVNLFINWGAMERDLGFSLELTDFILERYPGSMSPSSYKSKVILIDGDSRASHEIFMNNTLDYKGFRFFQSSYDADEKGTILSVNNDPGKMPTYIGYFLLFFSSVWLIFARGGRFQTLSKFLKAQKIYSAIFALILAFNGANLYAQDSLESRESSDENILLHLNLFKEKSLNHAKKFGELQIQSNDGKIKPINTLAGDLVHKITKKNNFLGFSNTQIALGMLLYPNEWKNIRMIRVSTPKLRELLGIAKNEKYASFSDLFILDESGQNSEYKLKNYIEEANRKNPANRSKFDSDIIDVDERANIAYGIYSSQFFRFLPMPQNGEIWISPMEMIAYGSEDLSAKIQEMLSNYFAAVDSALIDNDWARADAALDALKNYQREFSASEILLPENKLKAEIFLNESNLFKQLILPYIATGALIFILIFVLIFKGEGKQDSRLKIALKFLYCVAFFIVLAHFFALILRWYISGHAPWSNAYESMLYIAFISGVSGVIFFRKSYLALSSATFMAGIALFVANLGFMNPQITNLMPVLKSYWLNIHVSVITASYGFLGLCFLLGIIALILMIFRKKDSSDSRNLRLDSTINSICAINEMSMILGLFLLTAGNFLGAIWANESWGRYWGWDPKETWALVSIGVYAIILHLRFVFKRNLQYIFSSASVVGFFSVLMTYFGVNYYLSGLHSYAAGDPLPIPKFLYFMVIFVIILILGAFFKREMQKGA